MIMLSILIPSIPERMGQLRQTIERYQSYIDKYANTEFVQIVSVVDNKKVSIGEKRNALVKLAAGDYWVMSDDDDSLTESYFFHLSGMMISGCDVITYLQSARINEDKSTVKFGLKNINEQLVKDGITNRPAWHCCTWRKNAIKEARFAPTNWGEDDLFQRTANELAKTEYHIPEICHVYEHDSNLTTAFQ